LDPILAEIPLGAGDEVAVLRHAEGGANAGPRTILK
jgi:hypothetical protein